MNETQNVLWNMTDYRYVAFYIVFGRIFGSEGVTAKLSFFVL